MRKACGQHQRRSVYLSLFDGGGYSAVSDGSGSCWGRQRQHLELTRDIAQRFNGIYGDVFKVPDAYIGKVGARVMALQEPTKKMSKSDENQNNIITLMDDPKVIMNKMKRAMTDSDTEVRFAEEKPGISNLLSIYCAVTGKTIAEAEKEFAGAGYGTFKTAVGEAVVAELEPVQKRVKEAGGKQGLSGCDY